MKAHPWLVCGISGFELAPEERRLLEQLRPGGVILFARNIAEGEQVRALVREVRSLPGRPFVAVDLEGGLVNRFRGLVGELPSAAEAGAVGEEGARTLGEACGALCAALGIGVDFAPVLDLAQESSHVAEENRCWGSDAPSVVRLAGAFLEGLESFGVQGCLKHYPGLGSGQVDSHERLPILGDQVKEERRVFLALAGPERAVMVAHALAPALGEGVAPCSLSRRILASLPKNLGPIIADDVEMGALEGWGNLGERSVAALMAGCHLVLLCNALDQREAVACYVDQWQRRDPELAERLRKALVRSQQYGVHPLPPVTWDQALAKVEQLRSVVWETA